LQQAQAAMKARQLGARNKPAEEVPKSGGYLVGSSKYGWYKIGYSSKLRGRINDYSTLLPFEIDVQMTWDTTAGRELERGLHKEFASSRLCIDGHLTEWFTLTSEDLTRCDRMARAFQALVKLP
jgi:hypothetical protein